MILQNRKVAWIITAMLIVVGLFLGSFLSYHQMRGRVMRVFESEMEPLLTEQTQLFHNMQTIYNLNADNNVEMITEWAPDIAYRAGELQRRAESLSLSESDARFMHNFVIDIIELDLILRQANYNQQAQEFNALTQSGLGFLTLQSTRQLPIFE